MKFYFGEVDRKEAEEYGFDCFEYDGKLFDYCIEFTDGDIVISDSCNRSIPMDWTGFSALASLIQMKYNEIQCLASLYAAEGSLLSDEEDAIVAAV